MNKVSVEKAKTRTACAQVSEELLERYRRDPAHFISQLLIQDETRIHSTTTILNQNNKACIGTNEIAKIGMSLYCVTLFFHVVCNQPTTAIGRIYSND